MKSLRLLLLFPALLAGSAYAQSGLTYNGTFTMGSNAIASDPIIFTTMDAAQNIVNAGTFGGTVDFDPGAGITNVTAPSTWSSFLQKLDMNGNLQWVKSWGATGTCQPSGIVTCANGDIVVAGYFSGTVDCDPGPSTVSFTSPGMNNPYLVKYDANGNFMWAKHLSTTGNAFRSKVYYDATTSRIFWFGHFAGGTMDIDPGPAVNTITSAGGNDGFCVELDAAGNYIQHFQIGGTGSEVIYDVKTDATGNIFLSGGFAGTVDFDVTASVSTLTSVAQTDGFIAKYTSGGALTYAQQFGGTGFDNCYKLKILPTGEMYVGGTLSDGIIDLDPGAGTVSFNNSNVPTFYIVKLDNLGNYNNSATFTGGDAALVDFAVRTNGSLIVNGYYRNTVDFDPGAGTQNSSSGGPTIYDEYVLQMTAAFVYTDVRIRQNIATNIQYGGPKSIYYSGSTFLRSGTFSTTTDLDILSGVDNFTPATSYDYYVTRMSYCTSPTFSSTTANSCGPFTSPSGQIWNASGVYNDTIENTLGCDSIMTINLTVTNPLTPTISISGDDSICAGDVVLFSSSVTNEGSAPLYAWYKNGVYQGNAPTFNGFGLNNHDTIYATLQSNESCVTSANATSNEIVMVVGIANANASINISASPGNSACSADTIILTAQYFNGGNYPNFNWKLNNVPLLMNSSVIQLTGLSTGDQLNCILTSSDGCLTNAIDTSNTIVMTINQSAVPNITISGPNAICAGDTGFYSAAYTGGGSNPIVNWFINSSGSPVATGTSYSTSTWNNGDTLRCVLINNDICAVPNYDISNSIVITVGSSITPDMFISTASLTVCQGQFVTFSSNSIGQGNSPTYQWYVNSSLMPGDTNATFSTTSLNNSDVVNCMLTSNLSCAVPSTVSSNYLTMNVIPRSYHTQSPYICNGTTYTVGSNTYASSGFYSDTLVAITGCDSVVTTILTVLPPVNTSITQTGATLFANGTGSYQWIDCMTNQPIFGATSQSFTPAVNGTYAVIVTTSSCSDTSVCYNVIIMNINSADTPIAVSMYPNPTTDGSVKIILGTNISQGVLTVTNTLGQEVLMLTFNNQSVVDISIPGNSGVYFVTLVANEGTVTTRIIKN